MDENAKPARVGIASHLREEDKKHFCFLKMEVQAIGQTSYAIVLREQVACRCAAHYVTFKFCFN